MRLSFSLFAFALALYGQTRQVILVSGGAAPIPPATGTTSNLTVSAASNTQIQLDFDATGSVPLVEISKVADFSTLMPDTDAALFTGANAADREGNAINGGHYTVILGKRGTDVASNGLFVSRALETDTPYYVRVYRPGVSTLTTTATTRPVPFGLGYIPMTEVNTAKPGTFKFPTLSWTAHTSFIHPTTGVRFSVANLPSDYGFLDIEPLSIAIPAGAGWSNLAGLTTAGDSSYASVSNTTNKLFLAYPSGGIRSSIGTTAEGYSGRTINGYYGAFQANLSAAVNIGGTTPVSPVTLSACLTKNGSACNPDGKTILSAPLTTSLQAVDFGSTAIGDLWQATPGSPTIDYTAQSPVAGNAACNGTTTVAANASFFPMWLEQGSNINIGGVDYKLADSTNNYSRVTLTTVCPTNASIAWTANNFGVLVWMTTASANTIQIDFAQATSKVAWWKNMPDDGGIKYSSQITVPEPGTGNPLHFLRWANPAGDVGTYALNSVTGLARMVLNSGNIGATPVNGDMWDSATLLTVPTFYSSTLDGHVYQSKYYGSFQELPTDVSGFRVAQSYSAMPACSGTAPFLASQPCIVTVDLTTINNLGALTTAFTAADTPSFNSSKFTVFQLNDVDPSGNLHLTAHFVSGVQNSIAWDVVFNARATTNAEPGNAGCGALGCVVAAKSSWGSPHCRWCTFKQGNHAHEKWIQTQNILPWPGGNGGGPYTIQSVNGAADGASNVLDGTTSLIPCPANPYGADTSAVAPNCTKMTFLGEPIAPVHATDGGIAGELGAVKVGDWMAANYYAVGGSRYWQVMRVLSRTASATAGQYVLIFERDIINEPRSPFGYPHIYQNPAVNLPAFTMYCNTAPVAGNFNASGRGLWDFFDDAHARNLTGTTIVGDVGGANGHTSFDLLGDIVQSGLAYGTGGATTPLMPGVTADAYTTANTSRFGTGRTFNSVLTDTTQFFYQGQQIYFNGDTGANLGNMQSHPGVFGSTSLTPDAQHAGMYVDGRPYRGGFSSGNTGGSDQNTAPTSPGTRLSGDLFDFSPAQMKLTLPYSLNYPIHAYSGRVPLVNVSGTGCSLSGAVSDNYKFAIVAVAGECFSGSLANHTYVNAPHVADDFAGCFIANQAQTMTFSRDICISGESAFANAYTETKGDATELLLDGSQTRILMKMGEKVNNVFSSPIMTNLFDYGMFEFHLPPGGLAKALLIGKMPSKGTPDGIARNASVALTVSIPTQTNQVAWVRVGLAENAHAGQTGTAKFLNYSGRQEFCVSVVTAGTIDPSTPCFMETTQAGSWTPVDVSSVGATIKYPGIPGSTMYSQVVYRDKTTQALTLGAFGAQIVP